MSKAKQLLTSWRIILVLAALIFSFVAIAPQPWVGGAAVQGIEKGGAADVAGMKGPTPAENPTARERILAVDNMPVSSPQEFHQLAAGRAINETVAISTTKGVYRLKVQPAVNITVLPELEERVVEKTVVVNETVNGTDVVANKTVNETVLVNKTVTTILGPAGLGINVVPPAATNIRKGLDLQGGTRVLMQPATRLPPEDMQLLIEGMKQRLNVFGLSDIIVREASDLAGSTYVLVEVAGVNEDAVRDLLARQGKFEASVGGDVVFRGGNDIVDVCRSATCAGIDPQRGCIQAGPSDWTCAFRFSITLSQAAAVQQHSVIKDLPVVSDSGGGYLSKDLELFLDDELVDTLRIGSDLRNAPVTAIQISGSGTGATRDLAVSNAVESMKRLQTVLITGSLPVKMEIVQADTISPVLGEQFAKNALLIAVVSLLAVAAVLFVIYRRVVIALPMLVTGLSEIVIMLGVAAVIHWNIDLAAVAGIIAAVGTGVNDQIIIADEALRGELRRVHSWKEKVRTAFFIIMGAYLTTVVAMVPLFFAGAGMLRGFALITVIGVSIGVFITRPAYAKAVEILIK